MMMMMMTYRRPTREERTLINRALDRWGAFEFFQDKLILVEDSNKGSRQVCLVPQGIIIESAIVQAQPYFAGLVLGELSSSCPRCREPTSLQGSAGETSTMSQ